MNDKQIFQPDSSAVRVALWRAIHTLDDPGPHVFEDEIGLRLADPEKNWRDRPDMHPQGTKPFRASIVGRARFIEDLVDEAIKRGVDQYVILGAGLDTFVQRRPEVAAKLSVFEVDEPGTQAWKRQRLNELGYESSEKHRFVPVNFEKGELLWEQLEASGFNESKPAVVVSAGVSMYLTKDAIALTLRQAATLARDSTFAMTFLVPIQFADEEIRPWLEIADKGARESGTPFISYFTPAEMLDMARESGFKEVRHISAADLAERYFANRTDGLRPPNNTEEFLVATT